jgi:hypothetical protein
VAKNVLFKNFKEEKKFFLDGSKLLLANFSFPSTIEKTAFVLAYGLAHLRGLALILELALIQWLEYKSRLSTSLGHWF